jgi:hypothetical protein
MKKINYFFALLAILLVSCSDYLDVNTTENDPLTKDVPPRLVLAGAQSNAFNAQVGGTRMNQLGSVMMNSWAGDVNRVTGGYNTEFTQNFDNTFYTGIWGTIYLNVANFQKMIDSKEPNQGNYRAIAKILKAHYMQYIVDLYGKSPYNDAFKGEGNLSPAYTNDKEIYRSLVKELEEARALIVSSTNEEAVGTDVMLNGNMDLWAAFANTVELRIIMRQSRLNDGETVTYRNAKLKELADLNNFVSSNVTINPGYSAANDDKQNPFYNDFVRTSDGSSTQNRTFVVASDHMATFLNGTQTTPTNTVGVVDPRGSRMFVLSGGKVGGVKQGDVTLLAGGTAPKSANLSILGVGLTGAANGSANGGNTALVNGSSRNGFVMLASESYFLQAEAAVRYPSIFTGDAKALFTKGIESSFAFYSPKYAGFTLATLDPVAYITSTNGKSGLNWDATADKIQVIMTQKWLALTGIHGIEPYLDYVRTGFPVTPLAITANGTTKPKRFFYPLSEYVGNSANVPNTTLASLFTQGAFWAN